LFSAEKFKGLGQDYQTVMSSRRTGFS